MTRTCEIEGCEKRYVSRGLCQMHLHRLRRHGDVNVVKKPSHLRRYANRTCSVEGCALAYFARNLCQTHYVQRWRASDTPVCDMPGCTKPAHRYGLCERHDEEQASAPFYNPPRRPRPILPVVAWDEMLPALRARVPAIDTTFTRGEILAARP